MEITIGLSDKYRQEQFVQVGMLPPTQVRRTVSPKELSLALRQFLLSRNLDLVNSRVELNLPAPWTNPGDSNYTRLWEATSFPNDDWNTVLTCYQQDLEERLIQNQQAIQKHFDEVVLPKYEAALKDPTIYFHTSFVSKEFEHCKGYDRAVELAAERKRRVQESAEALKREEQEKAEAWKAKKAEEKKQKALWVSLFGSEALKARFDAGYDCQREYVMERTAQELPGYEPDFDEQLKWKERPYPSDEAFAEDQRTRAAGFDSKVVWIVYSVQDKGKGYKEVATSNFEAVLIKNYLGSYQAYRPF